MKVGDPEWLERFDSIEIRNVINSLSILLMERSELDRKLTVARQSIDQSRRFTRILSQTDPDKLLIQVREILELLGASNEVGNGDLIVMHTPHGTRFVLCAAASSLPCQAYQLELALARSGQTELLILLVVNCEAELDPMLRQPMAVYDLPQQVVFKTAQYLLSFLTSENQTDPESFWQHLDSYHHVGMR
jgi:hypothetical protein